MNQMGTKEVKIRNRDTGKVIFSAHIARETGQRLRAALDMAVRAGVNLAKADLQGADLQGANLQGANVKKADFSGARLGGGNLDGADFKAANLAGANLFDAHLDSATLVGANLTRTYLRGAYLIQADLSLANLQGADLQGANLDRANLRGTNFAGANLASTNLAGAYLEDGSILLGGDSIIQFGPIIGSIPQILVAYKTGRGIRFRSGAIFGDRDAFLKKMMKLSGQSEYYNVYASVISIIETVFTE